nr:hypothetical protein [Clostridia bacterium]
MEEFKFNSESSYKSTGERNGQEPIVLSFKSEPSCFAAPKKAKSRKGLATVLSLALVVCVSFASGAAGAFVVKNTTAEVPAETTVQTSPNIDAI